MYRFAYLVAVGASLASCRPGPVYVAEPLVHRGGEPCECWAPREVIEREVPEAERARLFVPHELLAEVAVFRARARGVEPDTTRQCSGYWGQRVLVRGPDGDSLSAALESVGGSGSLLAFPPHGGLQHLRAKLDVRQISELIRSPAVAAVSGMPVTCGTIGAAYRADG